jgi:hypothetical protein
VDRETPWRLRSSEPPCAGPTYRAAPVQGHAPARASAMRPHACSRLAGRALPYGQPAVSTTTMRAHSTPSRITPVRSHKHQGRRAPSRERVAVGLARRHRPVHGRRALRSSGRLCGASLLPLERRLISLNSTAPQPACQDAPVPDQERNSGRSRTSTPPAPFDHISPPSKPQNEIVVSPSSLPTTSPVNPGDELAGLWSSPPAMAPEDYIASISVFPGRFLQVSRDPVVKVKVRDSAVPSKNH